ncbi:MAG: hypothetical protein ACOCWG_03385, partial [bacterium]
IDYKACLKAFWENYEEGDQIVSGGCPQGGDKFAEIIAKKHQIPIKIYYAQWNRIGKSAGFRRNGNIAEDCDILIAVVSSDRKGGTEDTIQKAEKMNKKVILVRTPDNVSPSEIEIIEP